MRCEALKSEAALPSGFDVQEICRLIRSHAQVPRRARRVHLEEWGRAHDLSAAQLVAVRAALASETLRYRASSSAVEEKSRGALFDYDSPRKERWRLAWRDFLGRTMSPEELRQARVICLPSQDPLREVRHYLELGVQPCNILAIEGAEVVRESFEANARALGIQHRFGRLQELLLSLPGPFSIVSYDFTGPISQDLVTALHRTPMATRCAVLVNILGAREMKDSQQAIQYFRETSVGRLADVVAEVDAEFMKGRKPEALTRAEKESRQEAIAARMQDLLAQRSAEPLRHFRESGWERLVKSNLGVFRSDRRRACAEAIATVADGFPSGESKEMRICAALDLLHAESAMHYSPFYEFNAIVDKVMRGKLGYPICEAMLRAVLSGNPYFEQLERATYRSEMSASGAPFHSIFGIVRLPVVELSACAHAAEFLSRHLVMRARDEQSHDAATGVVHRYQFRVEGEPGPRDVNPERAVRKLELVTYRNGKRFDSIRGVSLTSAISAFEKLLQSIPDQKQLIAQARANEIV